MSKPYFMSGCELRLRLVVTTLASVMLCLTHATGASTNDMTMDAVYRLLPAMLSGESLSVPLLAPWSSPTYAITPQGFSVSNVYSRGTARWAVYEKAFDIKGHTQNSEVVEADDGFVLVQHLGSGTSSNTNFRFDNWKALPLEGEWRAHANDGRYWSGHLNRPDELPYTTTKQVISDALLVAVLNQLPDESKNARAIGIRVQVDGHMYPIKGPGGFPGTLIDGAFVAGYLVDGQRAGLWVTARSSGGLSLVYYAAGRPCGIEVDCLSAPYYWKTTSACFLRSCHPTKDADISLTFRKGRIVDMRCFPKDPQVTCVQAHWNEDGKVKGLWMDATPKNPFPCDLKGY